MQKSREVWVKRGVGAGVAAALAALMIWALLPNPVDVELGRAEVKPLRVTVDEEGKTRIRNVYVITAPIAGTMRRSPLKVGDAVEKNDTTVAVILPPSPTFRDFRTSLELESTVKSCEANVALAEAELRQAQADLQLSKSEQARVRTLAERGVSPARALEQADADLKIKEAAVTRAKAAVEVRKRELDNARIRQLGPEEPAVRQGTSGSCSFDVKSPESGQVLKLIAESEQPIAMGAPVMELGNPANLELVVDLLSSDAVKVSVGAKATVVDWGGPPLNAHVTRIEPSGFTKVSALGIEEQRVRTILAIDDPLEVWQRLGHDYRVFVRIAVFESPQALVVPLGALFRRGAEWSVFRAVNGRAKEQIVRIGQRNTSVAQVLDGLAAGDPIILHPSDRVADGVRVSERIVED